MHNSLGFALVLAALLIAPSAARASSKCICDNGKTLTIASDDEDACAASCDLFGGGHAMTPDEEQTDEAAEAAAPSRTRRVVAKPAAPAAPSGAQGAADPHNQP